MSTDVSDAGELPELLALARDIASVYDDDRLLNHLITLGDARGVSGLTERTQRDG